MGLKAKPTKPVTEVLRPVVAKYGLDLSGLLVRLVSVAWGPGVITTGTVCSLWQPLWWSLKRAHQEAVSSPDFVVPLGGKETASAIPSSHSVQWEPSWFICTLVIPKRIDI